MVTMFAILLASFVCTLIYKFKFTPQGIIHSLLWYLNGALLLSMAGVLTDFTFYKHIMYEPFLALMFFICYLTIGYILCSLGNRVGLIATNLIKH